MAKMRTSFLTSTDSTGHVHLIIGTNSLVASRCAKSLEVGAKPILIAPEVVESELHPALWQLIEEEKVQWLKKTFEDADISTLGRSEIDRYVDAVFVTLTPRDPESAFHHPP
jgi:uroporphyrin-III C-methyltransferase